MTPPPVVTGLSPNDGPPGTRITIRGENFGAKITDLTGLSICGCDCLLSAEWKSPSKIIAITGPGKGLGDVLVTTRSGGIGTCSVKFKGYYENIGPMKDSAVWVEETSFYPWDRHSLSSTSFQQDDPLGLSVEGSERKLSEDNLQEKFPNSSGDITAQNFSASWFLLENHLATTFNDLQAGLLHLRRKVEGQKEGHLSFLKTNVSAVIDQVDTLMALKEKYESDINSFGSESTSKLEKAIKESEREASKLYDDVLTRRDRAEKTRNALNVLTRFKFLFCLPCTIDRNMKKGDYDIIINDYMRVKNLFLKREIPVFKMALNEIDRRIIGIKKLLHAKLTKMPINVEEQKRLIRYLTNLDSNFEPAWDAINGHSDYLLSRMKQCYDEHKAIIVDDTAKSKNPNAISKYSKYTNPVQETNTCPQNIFYVEEMCDIISELFPDIWKLGQAYFTGELHVKVEAGHKTAYKHMVLNIMEVFTKRLRAAIIPHTLEKTAEKNAHDNWTLPDVDIMAIYLPDCLRYVRSSYAILVRLDLPSEALDIVLMYILDLRIHCMCMLFKKSTDTIHRFSKQEHWKIEISESHCGITNLPLKFEQTVQDLLQVISESVLKSEPREGPLLESQLAQKEFEKQIEHLLLAFYVVLDSLTNKGSSDDDDDENRSPIVSQLIGTPSTAYRIRSHSQRPVWEHRLLMTLANCQYTINVVLNNILESFSKIGYNISQNTLKKSRNDLENLERSILESYLEQKSDPLVGTIEPSMYLGRFDWDTKINPVDLRPYAKECINNLIHVHFEVNSISSKLIDNVLPQVVQTIAEELYRLMSCVQKFSKEGVQQAHIDIRTLQEIFSGYSTQKAKDHFKEAIELIPPLNHDELMIVEDILRKCRTKMKLQILCLQKS